MSYKGLKKVQAERAAKEATKEAKKAVREAKKAEKEAKKAAKEEATVSKKKLRRSKITQRKSPEKAGTPEPKVKLARMSEGQVIEDEIVPESWRAPVARMW